MTEEEIVKICQEYNIENYTINDNMSINVNGDVNLPKMHLTHLPLNFSKVTGKFNCGNNRLTTLEGCPLYVGGHFCCYGNNLSTLEHCPVYVGDDFYCQLNELTTLQHLPVNFYINISFYCYKNKISEAKEFSKLFFGTINGVIETDYQYLDGFLNKNKNPPKKDLPRLLSELRKIQL